MSNQYYNFVDIAESGTIVDPFDYNREMEKITEAFSVVPPASQLTSGTLNYSTDTGTGNDHVATLDDFDPDYVTGSNVALKINDASTGPSTLSVNNLAPKDVVLSVFGAVTAGDLFAEGVYTFVYNGSRFQIMEMGARYYTTAFEQRDIALAREIDATASRNSATASLNAVLADKATSESKLNDTNISATTAADKAIAATGSANSAAIKATEASRGAITAAGNLSTVTRKADEATVSAGVAEGKADEATVSAGVAEGKADEATVSAVSAAESAAIAVALINDPGFNDRVRDAILNIEYKTGSVEFFDRLTDPNVDFPGSVWERLPADVTIRLANATGTDVFTQVGSDTATLAVANVPAHNHPVTMGTVSSADLGTKTSSSFDYGTKTLANFTDSTKTSSSFDYGTKTTSGWAPGRLTTSSAGAHTHTIPGDYLNSFQNRNRVYNSTNTSVSGTIATGSSGAHTHTVDPGAHTHTVAMGGHNHTASLGSHTHTVGIGAHSHSVAMGSHGHSATLSLTNTGSGATFDVVESSLILVAWYRSA